MSLILLTPPPRDFFFYTQMTVAAVPNWIFDLQTSNYKLSHLFPGYAQITSLGLIIHSLRITVIKTEKAITSSTNWFLLNLRWLFNLLEPTLLDKIAHNIESKLLSLGTEQWKRWRSQQNQSGIVNISGDTLQRLPLTINDSCTSFRIRNSKKYRSNYWL